MRLRVATARPCTIAVAADQTILDWHSFPRFSLKARQQFRPYQASVRIPGKAVETPDPSIEPAFQCGSLLSRGKDKNTEAQFP